MTDMDVLKPIAKPNLSGRGLLDGALDWMGPGQSLMSYRALPSGGLLTPSEFAKVEFLRPPGCARCAFPFDYDEGDGLYCGACLSHPPLFGRARSALIYSDAVSSLVLGLKRQGRRAGLRFFAGLMYEAGRNLVDTADILIPVPLHATRLFQRGFNQSGWLATGLAQISGAPVDHGLLVRRRASPSQGRLSVLQRRANVAGAFDVRPSGRQRISGRRILLVDDVLTTGATVEACIRALNRAKAVNVDVITLSRVVTPQKPTI